MELFGERGYAATSVADIQIACGLTGGSGALYKHFASKRDVLAEGVRRYVAGMEDATGSLVAALPDDSREALTVIAHAASKAMTDDRSVIRVGLRDLEQFPDLLAILWGGLLAALYRELAQWLDARQAQGRAAVSNPPATAAVLVASLTYFRVLEALIGHTPGDIDPDSYLSAWVDSALATIGAGGD
jgi:AcrR family transcriptional regulator